MNQPLPRVAVLASGRGSNLGALLAARDRGDLAVDIVLVASDKPSAGALTLAEDAGIRTLVLDPRRFADRRSFDLALFEQLAASGAEYLVLAGFMRIIDADALAPWIGRMINIHPSLLPKYRGLHTHRRALEAGDAEHGASVHFVTAELDGGPLLAQVCIPVLPEDMEESLAERLLPLEHRLLPAVLQLVVSGRLRWHEQTVQYDGRPLRQPLRLNDQGLHPAE